MRCNQCPLLKKCASDAHVTLCLRKVRNGMKINDKRKKKAPASLRLNALTVKQVFEYINQSHNAHRSIYMVLEQTQYLDQRLDSRFVLDLRTNKVCCHHELKRVQIIEAEMVLSGDGPKLMIPTLGSIDEKKVFEYIKPDSQWLKGTFVKMGRQGSHYLPYQSGKSWVYNITTGNVGSHHNRNQVETLDAEFVVNG